MAGHLLPLLPPGPQEAGGRHPAHGHLAGAPPAEGGASGRERGGGSEGGGGD